MSKNEFLMGGMQQDFSPKRTDFTNIADEIKVINKKIDVIINILSIRLLNDTEIKEIKKQFEDLDKSIGNK